MIVYEKIPAVLFECTVFLAHEQQQAPVLLVLKTLGFHQDSVCETWDHQKRSLKIFSEDQRAVDVFKKAFVRLKFPGLRIVVKSLKPAEWLTRWKDHWKPLSLTKEIAVIPAWYKDRYSSSKKIIYLDTLMSFGTGMHETTQLMARLIEKYKARLGSFLDIGTGTGILALTALKLGAKDVTAMDISPLSVQAAKKNFKVNGLKAKIVLADIDGFKPKRRYDMIAANLITDDLLKFKKQIADLVNQGGVLMVSGISLDNVSRLKKGFKELPFVCRQSCLGKQWAAFLYEKKMS